jgi:hypothetical protein
MGEMFCDVLAADLAKAMEVAATGSPCQVGHYLIVDLDKKCGLKASYNTTLMGEHRDMAPSEDTPAQVNTETPGN